MVASLSATLVFRKAKKIDWPLALVLESVTTIGSFIGGLISGNISGQHLSWFFSALGGFAGHLVAGHWDWKTSLILGVAVFIEGQIGARKALSIDKKKMKKLFGWFLLSIALLMALKDMPTDYLRQLATTISQLLNNL